MSAVRSLSGARQTGVSRTQQPPLSPMGCHCNPSPARGIDGLPEPWRRSPRSGSTGVSRHERKPERGVGDDHARQSERPAPQYNHKTHQSFVAETAGRDPAEQSSEQQERPGEWHCCHSPDDIRVRVRLHAGIRLVPWGNLQVLH
jgi:hypothetical protein